MKRQVTNGEKSLQRIYVVKDLYSEYVKNSQNSIKRKAPNLKCIEYLNKIYG